MMIFCFFVLVNPGFSGDLDDGISKYTDDGVTKYDDLGDPEKNSDSGGSMDTSKGANMNSVVLGAGGIIKGDVYIIDESRGSKTQVVDK